MKLSNKTYDVLKWLALVVLPACGVLYAALSNIWSLPFGEEIPATVMAVEAFLGAVLQISNVKYKAENAIVGDVNE